MAYWPRVVDAELEARLAASGVVVLEGPKACGKTLLARQIAESEVLLDVDPSARAAVAVDPGLVLEGATPRLIDEWQIEPALWNHVRRTVDDRGKPGQFILTGSAVPSDDITRHTGAGRIARIRMRPMSLFESRHSSGEISLEGLLNGEPARCRDPGLNVPQIAERVCVGGWPGFQELPVPEALIAVSSYLDEIRRTDINRVDGARRDPERVLKTVRSLARNVGTAAAVTKLAADTGGDGEDDDAQLARNTIYDHMSALERLMVIEDQPAWAPHLRSRSRVRAAAKRHFTDPSLAVAALGASPEKLLMDLNFLGLLFESLVVRDLRVYAQRADAQVLQYHDNTGLEVDAIVEARDGRWGAFEVKLGGADAIEAGAASLLGFAARVDTKKTGSPAVLALIVGTGYGYVRDDGVAVIPIGALAP